MGLVDGDQRFRKLKRSGLERFLPALESRFGLISVIDHCDLHHQSVSCFKDSFALFG